MTGMVDARINERWALVLPDFRADFHAARPKWEQGRLDSCAETFRPGWCVWDVGAEHGDFTALYKLWVGDAGEVVPIEPSPGYWPCIKATYEANDLPAPPWWWPGFAGDRTTAEAFRPMLNEIGWPHREWPTWVDEYAVVEDYGFRHYAEQVEVIPTCRLDELPAPRPDAIVMDIEGAEWHALSGAAGLLAERRVMLWVSVHPPTMWEWYGKTVDDLLALMASFGYSAEQLPHNGEGEDFWLFTP